MINQEKELKELKENYHNQMLQMKAALCTEGGKKIMEQLKMEILQSCDDHIGMAAKEGKIQIYNQYSKILNYGN